MNVLKKAFLLKTLAAFFILALPVQSWAQAGGNQKKEALETREVIGTVLVSGLVGGILGLSTLSFYTEPQEHIRNITIGAGVGMIIGIILITSSAASTDIEVDEDKTTTMIYPVVNPDSVNLAATFRF